MTDDLDRCRLAILVDAENMKPEYMRQILPHVFKLGRPVIQYAFGDFSQPAAKPWVGFLRANVIEARQVTPAESGKNAADIALVVEAMRLALGGKCDALCIISSDRDFVALTTFLRGEGVDVYGFGLARTDKKYRQSCAKFFEVKDEALAGPGNSEKPQPALTLLSDATPKTGSALAIIVQEIARLADKEGWVTLQTLGLELGKRGLRAKDHGGANWGAVINRHEGLETRKDKTGRRSVRLALKGQAAA